MRKYEYHVLQFISRKKLLSTDNNFNPTEMQEELNRLGLLGWELINAVEEASHGYSTVIKLFLKREIS